jgi:protein SCO1/2
MRGVLVVFALLMFGCRAPEPIPESGTRYYESTGTVISVEEGLVVLDHEDIPGFMDAMTMSFRVSEPALLEGLEAGARVSFRVAVEGSVYQVDRIELLSPPP